MSSTPDRHGDATPPENMSVSELRQWLKAFGNKQQEHFSQGQAHNDRRRSPTTAMTSTGSKGLPKDKDCSNSQQTNYYRSGNFMAIKQRVVPKTMPSEPSESSQENHGLSQLNNMSFDAPITRSKEKGGKEELFRPSNVFHADKNAHKPEDEIRIVDSKLSYFPSDEVPIVESKSSDLPEVPILKQIDELTLALSAVTLKDSSSSVQAEPSDSIAQLTLAGSVDEETFDMDGIQNNPFSPRESKRDAEETVRKAVPADWSDLEPVDFDASNEGSSGSDKDDDDRFVSPSVTWPIWSQRGESDAREYLKKQALASFQGYWSDTECEDDEEEDGTVYSVATDYQKRNTKSARARRARERRTRGLLPLETSFEGSPTNFTLADAAKESRGVPHPRSKTNSLSDHFLLNAKVKPPKECAPHQTMHNANLFQNTMITAGALDLICHDRAKPRPTPPSHREAIFNNQNATSSTSSDGSGGPSVAPNAVDAKLAKVFSDQTDNTECVTVSSTPEKRQPRQSRTLDKSDDKRQGAPAPPFSPGKMRIQEWVDAAEKIEQQQETQTQFKPIIAPSSKTFFSAIEKFGGRGKKSRQKTKVELRKEALEAQWATSRDDKQAKETKKTKWEVSRTPGTYKKKVVVGEK